MKKKIKLLDVVTSLISSSDENLEKGQVGTVVKEYLGNFYEVEFSNKSGVGMLLKTMHEKDLMLLHFEMTAA